MSKLLRRWIIIREKDYEKWQVAARKLYDTVKWRPMTLDELEQENIIALLKNPARHVPWHLDPLQQLLWTHSDRCYKSEYPTWKITQDGDNLLIKPNRTNGKISRLGIATVERHY